MEVHDPVPLARHGPYDERHGHCAEQAVEVQQTERHGKERQDERDRQQQRKKKKKKTSVRNIVAKMCYPYHALHASYLQILYPPLMRWCAKAV